MAAQATIVSPAIRRKADELLARSDRWAHGYRKHDGLQFVVFASQSAPGVYYQTRIDGAFCTCPAARLSRAGRCCHKVAVAEKYQQARSRPFRTLEELMGDDASLVDAF